MRSNYFPYNRRNKHIQTNKLLWFSLFFIVLFAALLSVVLYKKYKADYFDMAIINAIIHDGSKNGKGFKGGIGIRGSKIEKVWSGKSWIIPRAKIIIDAKGADLSPGFIDTHSHADLSISNSGKGKVRADNFVGQGITTLVVGNCGRSHADIPTFTRSFDSRKSNINIATLIGLNTVRKKVMNDSNAPANSSEIARMREIIRDGMKAGALGVSTGLEYPPGIFASKDEMIAQMKVAKEFGGIHTTHMRSEGGEIAKAVEEVIELSNIVDIPLLISHYKVTGLNNCNQFEITEKLISQARAMGMKIYIDYYPYDASSTNLNIFLPKWYLALDQKGKSKIMTTATSREKLKNNIIEIMKSEGFNDFKFAAVSYYLPHHEWQGRTLEEIDRLHRKSTVSTLDTQLDIFLEMESHGGAQMVYHNICPDVMERIPKEEENMVGTDSAIRYENTDALPHPRGWGTFPRFIKHFVQERKLFSLDVAIYRMSGLPANVFKLENRGQIKKGFYADLVVFDSTNIKDIATYSNPFAPPIGIKYVIVNGKIIVDNLTKSSLPNNSNVNILDSYPGVFVKRMN